MINEDLWKHRVPPHELIRPPKPANPHVAAAIAQQGIIGQCLHDALQEVIQQDNNDLEEKLDEKDEEDSKNDEDATSSNSQHASVSKLKLKQHMAENVMKEFGQAVARTSWRAANQNLNRTTEGREQVPKPPAALLRGRLDHYNRFQGRWRIAVHRAEFKRRTILPKFRKKMSKSLLWDAVEASRQENSTNADATTSNRRSVPNMLQILAYNDS